MIADDIVNYFDTRLNVVPPGTGKGEYYLQELKCCDKYALTIEEASEYFGIGQKKLRQLMEENEGADFILRNGAKRVIKRKKFEQFLDRTSSV